MAGELLRVGTETRTAVVGIRWLAVRRVDLVDRLTVVDQRPILRLALRLRLDIRLRSRPTAQSRVCRHHRLGPCGRLTAIRRPPRGLHDRGVVLRSTVETADCRRHISDRIANDHASRRWCRGDCGGVSRVLAGRAGRRSLVLVLCVSGQVHGQLLAASGGGPHARCGRRVLARPQRSRGGPSAAPTCAAAPWGPELFDLPRALANSDVGRSVGVCHGRVPLRVALPGCRRGQRNHPCAHHCRGNGVRPSRRSAERKVGGAPCRRLVDATCRVRGCGLSDRGR